MEIIGLFLSLDTEFFAATAASAFALRSSFNTCRLRNTFFRPGMRYLFCLTNDKLEGREVSFCLRTL